MGLKISRILHAGYVFEFEGSVIAFDPIFENPFSRNCYAFPRVRFDIDKIRTLKFDAVFISHHHDDHCSLESLDLLDRGTPIYLYCVFDELFAMIRQLGFLEVHELKIDQPVSVGSMQITPCRAVDEDLDSMFHVRAGDIHVLNVVDAWIHPSALDRLAKYAPWDMVLWPFQTMREIEVLAPSRALPPPDVIPGEFIEQLQILESRFVVPSSCQFMHEDWSWYNQALFPISYAQFRDQIESAIPRTRVVRMNPSVSIYLDKFSIEASEPLTWIQPIGDQDLDYSFAPELKAPTTADIAKRFPPLSAEQTKAVHEYCRSELIATYNSLADPVDEYFEGPLIWRLSLYDVESGCVRFHYRIASGKIELMDCASDEIGWTTELPACKLSAALESGETFTSMYFRINDTRFSQSVETEIAEVDFSADPLVHCLFGGEFASYQREQLQRLLKTHS